MDSLETVPHLRAASADRSSTNSLPGVKSYSGGDNRMNLTLLVRLVISVSKCGASERINDFGCQSLVFRLDAQTKPREDGRLV